MATVPSALDVPPRRRWLVANLHGVFGKAEYEQIATVLLNAASEAQRWIGVYESELVAESGAAIRYIGRMADAGWL